MYEIVNVATARAGVKGVCEYLYRALQIAARQPLGKRTLEQVFAEKTDIDEAVIGEGLPGDGRLRCSREHDRSQG